MADVRLQTGQTRWQRGRPLAGAWCDLSMGLVATVFVMVPASVPLWLLGAIPAIAAVRWQLTGGLWTRTPLDWPLGILLLLGIASLAMTGFPDATHEAFVYLVSGVTMLAAMAGWGTSPRRLGLALGALGVLGLALIALSPLTARVLEMWPQAPGELRSLFELGSGAINPNILGGAIALLAPLALALAVGGPALARGTFARIAAGLLFIGLCAAAARTGARGASVGIAAGSVLTLVLTSHRFVWLIPIGVAATAVGTFGFGRPALKAWASLADASMGDRLAIWSRAISLLRAFPFTGVGMGAFGQSADILYPFLRVGPHAPISHAHNLFLQVGVDLGLPGLVAYLVLLGLSVWMAADVLRQGSTGWLGQPVRRSRTHWRWTHPLAIGLLGSQAALVAHGLLDAAAWGVKPALLAWATWGLMAALWRMSRDGSCEVLQKRLWPRRQKTLPPGTTRV